MFDDEDETELSGFLGIALALSAIASTLNDNDRVFIHEKSCRTYFGLNQCSCSPIVLTGKEIKNALFDN